MSRPNAKTRERLRRAVEHAERHRRNRTGPSIDSADARPGFWAEITGDESGAASGPTGYSWKRMQNDAAGGLEDDVDTITGTGTAFEINATTGIADGTRCWLNFAGFIDDGSGNDVPLYLFGVGGGGTTAAEITALASDYITVKFINPADGTATGSGFKVAKPQKLRHDAANHSRVTTLSTNSANQVDVSDGSNDETWEVVPLLEVGDQVEIQHTNYSGVDDGGDDIKWTLLGPWAWTDVTGISS